MYCFNYYIIIYHRLANLSRSVDLNIYICYKRYKRVQENYMKVQKFIKKIIDFVAAFIGLVVLSLAFVFTAILIKLDSKGPVFFKQERLGKKGKVFKVWKFRTMIENAENIGLGLASAENDSRVTKAGKFLRKWTFDEWPQLINVIRGEMSLVGPRPLPSEYKNKDNSSNQLLWQKRLSTKPGLISLVDIKGRGLVSFEKGLKYDAWYVDNWSLRLDFKILIIGFFVVLSREGIYGDW